MGDRIETAAEAHENAVLPRRRDIHSDPNAVPADELPEELANANVEEKSPAEWAYERLILYIRDFENTLDAEHEVAMGFAGGDVGVMRIEGLGFFDPDIVTFYGSDASGVKTQLIQHVTQLSVMLRALPKQVEQDAPLRIGFQLAQELEKG